MIAWVAPLLRSTLCWPKQMRL